MSTPPREVDSQTKTPEAARGMDAATAAIVVDDMAKPSPVSGAAIKVQSEADSRKLTETKVIPPLTVDKAAPNGAQPDSRTHIQALAERDKALHVKKGPAAPEHTSCKVILKSTVPSHTHPPDFFKPRPLTPEERRREDEIHGPKSLNRKSTESHKHPAIKPDTPASTKAEHRHIPVTHDDELSRRDAEFHRDFMQRHAAPSDASSQQTESKSPITTKSSQAKPSETPPKLHR